MNERSSSSSSRSSSRVGRQPSSVQLCSFDVMKETPFDIVNHYIKRFENAAKSAAAKDHAVDLTEEEACVICLFAGVPYRIDPETGMMKFQVCGLYKRDGKWIALLHGGDL